MMLQDLMVLAKQAYIGIFGEIADWEQELRDSEAQKDLQVIKDAFQIALTQSQWRPIVELDVTRHDEEMDFWVRPKTAEESYCDTSGNPIFSTHAPRRHRGKYGTWSSLEKATHWMPLPPPPMETP